MKHSFIDLCRQPDSVLFQYEDSGVRFEEPDGREEQSARLEYRLEDGAGVVVLYPSERPYKRVKLRFRGDLSDSLMMMGDAYERTVGQTAWSGITPHLEMPWYFYLYDGEALHGFGVRTGPSCVATFECDPYGITLWLDVRNGGGGVALREPLRAAEVVCRRGTPGEIPYFAAREFCRMMCPRPNLPKEPVFGVNNWYWAYGNITHASVMEETDALMEMTEGAACRPYMTIDDGWQRHRFTSRTGVYNGGPWDAVNEGFSSMRETAEAIHEKGARAGIWFRPLQTCVRVPREAEGPKPCRGDGFYLDPSHPFTKEQVSRDTAMIRSWGYDLIKHDFSTFDTTDTYPYADGDWHFYDRTRTNAEILRDFYRTVEEAAGGAVVIGCNTVNHLVAGIHAVQRSGGDTSGRNFEVTRRDGGASLMRLPQNGTFFAADPDCAAFTAQVDHGLNLDFLEACAISGAVTLASVTPHTLRPAEMKRIREIFSIASRGGLGAYPTDWLGHNVPSRFETPDGRRFDFNWYRVYDGVRRFYTWGN